MLENLYVGEYFDSEKRLSMQLTFNFRDLNSG